MSEFQRQHPAAAITRLASVIRENLITFILVAFFGLRGSDNEYTLLIFIGALVFALMYGVASWWQYRFRVDNGELHIEYGVFVRQKLYLNQERIQVIDITEGIIQRMFGLVKMEIKTAGSGTEKASISAINREKALEIQRLLRKNGNRETAGQEEEENALEASPGIVRKLSFRDLILAALTSGSIGIIASIIGAVSSQLDQFINEETIDYMYKLLPGVDNVLLITFIVVTLLIVSWVLSFLGVVFQNAEFTIEKTEQELRITRGLLERKHATIPLNRIQAVRYVEGLLRLPFGFGMLYVESAGFQQDKARSVVVFPLIRSDEVSSFLNEFLPGFSFRKLTAVPSPRAFYRYLRRPNYVVLGVVGAAWLVFSSFIYWLLLLIIPATWLGWQSFRESGVGVGQEDMVMRQRFFSRTTTMLKRNRIQAVNHSQNPFQKRKDLADYSVTVASGRGGMEFRLKDADISESSELVSWVRPVSQKLYSEQQSNHC